MDDPCILLKDFYDRVLAPVFCLHHTPGGINPVITVIILVVRTKYLSDKYTNCQSTRLTFYCPNNTLSSV